MVETSTVDNNVDSKIANAIEKLSLLSTTKIENSDHYNPSVREVNIPKLENGSCGFHLSRSKWDPYPWVSGVDKESKADLTGLKVGDCVLEVNGEDILGLRIADVANLVKVKPENVTLLLWTTGMEPSCNPESLCCGPMPLNLDRLSASVQTILAALECPICLDTIPPPVMQCMNGHLVCLKCRIKADKCPICRQRYSSGRSLIAEQVYNSITDAFKVREEDGKLRERLFGVQCRKLISNDNSKVAPQSHTNKFLAKIMGKATSLDSLPGPKKDSNGRDEISKTKQLSLSVNEIFRTNSSAPSSRSTSPHRLTPELGSQTHLGTRRPASRSVSAESLNEDILQLIVPKPDERSYYCACDDNCDQKLKSSELRKHIINYHNIPIIEFGQSSAEIALPPRVPVDQSCLVLTIDHLYFWLKLQYVDSHYFIAALVQSSDDACSKYYLEVKIGHSSRKNILSKEIVTRCTVHSLEHKSWKNVLDKKDGICFSKESITSTFGENTDILLTASVKNIV